MIIEDIQDLDKEKQEIDDLCFKMGIDYEIIDLRNNKHKYDDILLTFQKK